MSGLILENQPSIIMEKQCFSSRFGFLKNKICKVVAFHYLKWTVDRVLGKKQDLTATAFQNQ
jgi:hypothetical protein